MRKTSLSLRKTRINGVLFWQVTVPKLGGGRERKTFREREEAQTFFDTSKIQQENYGTAALSISDALRVEATECAAQLKEYGKSLRDATAFYLAHLKAVTNSKKVRDVVAEMIEAKEADGAKGRYLKDLRDRLARFVATFGESMIAGINAKQISDWLRSLNVGWLTRNTFRLRLSALYAFAIQSGYAPENPVERVAKAKGESAEAEFLTVGETARLLERAGVETLPYWAIGAFAGLRTAELERLHWEEVDFDGGHIEVKAGKAKTAARRVVPIQPNLMQWLAPYQGRSGAIIPSDLRRRLLTDRERAGLREEWPDNGTRHSYGTYRLPIIKNVAQLAFEMGNSPEICHKHYVGKPLKPKDAERFWSIAPVAAENVVALTA